MQRRYFRFYKRVSHWTFLRDVSASPASWRAEHWLVGGIAVVVCVLAGIVAPTFANATRHEPMPVTTMTLELPQLPADPAIGAYAASTEPDWRIVSVNPGQSLSDIFSEQGFSSTDLQRALDSQNDASALRHIRPGQEFAFATDASGALTPLRARAEIATPSAVSAFIRQYGSSTKTTAPHVPTTSAAPA